MSNTTKQVTMSVTIACLLFLVHSTSATEELPLQQLHKPHITGSKVKTVFMDLTKEAGRIVVSSVRQQPDVMFVCGILLAAAGSYILLKTIMSDIPKILGSTVMIGTGAALVFLANQKEAPPTPNP